MRIIAGQWRGRRLVAPVGDATRPTADRTRETLFSMLVSRLGDFSGLAVGDLFAGSGALGLEALSRGAASVQFVERDARVAQALRQNLERLKVAAASVAVVDAQAFLNGPPQPMDMVFLDPPFALDLWSTLAQQLEQGGWLTNAATVYVECPQGSFPSLPPTWQLHKQSRAGDVCFALFRR